MPVTPGPDLHPAEAGEKSAVRALGRQTAHPLVRRKLAAELREAALRAREFVRSHKSPEVKESFLGLAAKWEAEAQAIEAAP